MPTPITAPIAYDANGAQISQTTASGTSAQTWDFDGHLRAQGQVDAQGQWNGARTGYNYGASGIRLTQAQFSAAGTLTSGTSYVWNGDRVAEERDASGVLQGVYEHGQELGPLRLRRLKDGAWQNRFFGGDGQDSTRQLMNEAGVVTDSYFYDSFGNALNGGQGTTNNSFKYTGQQQDASGLYYLRARYYNAGTGRFLSQDPEMGAASDPVSMHRYLYAGADPVNGCDPTGRETCAEMCTSICINMALTAGRNAALGAAFGGVVGAGVAAGDSYFSGGTPSDVVNAEIQGAIQGAKFGALGSIRMFQIPLMLYSAFKTGQGVGQAVAQGNNGLAAYRAGTFLALSLAAKACSENPTSAAERNVQIARNQAELARDPFEDEVGAAHDLGGGSLTSLLGVNDVPLGEDPSNCVPTAIAADQTLAGTYTKASQIEPLLSRSPSGSFNGQTLIDYCGFRPPILNSLEEVTSFFNNAFGDGSGRAIIVGFRNGAPGHAFNAVVTGGSVEMVDAQNMCPTDLSSAQHYTQYGVWITKSALD